MKNNDIILTYSKPVSNTLTYEFEPSGEIKKEDNPKTSFYFYITAFMTCLVMLICGCVPIWSAVCLSKLQSNNTDINPLGYPINSIQESWISSLSLLGAAIGPWMSSKTADTYGRRKTLFLIISLMLISFLILTWSSNIIIFYIGRLLGGLGMGICLSVLPMYMSEICDDHNRGKFGSILMLFNIFGLLYGMVVGPYLSIKLFSISCTIPLVIALLSSLSFFPETPSFLATWRRKEKAVAVLKKIRNKNSLDAENDYFEILEEIQKSSNKSGLIELFKSNVARKGLLICTGLFLLQQFCGIGSIVSFIWPIFDSTGTGISTYLSTVLVGILQTISLLISTAIIDKLGRKFLLLSSSIGLTVSLILLGLYFYLKTVGFSEIGSFFWLPIASILSYIFFFFLGMGSIPYVVIGEIFSPNFRSLAYSICSSTCAFSGFLVTGIFPFAVKLLGEAMCFWIYAGFSIVGVIFIVVFVPETKGKSLQAIHKLLSQ